MHYLLLIAHGSRREQSNREVEGVTKRLAVHASSSFDATRCAFLEMVEPSIAQVIDDCVDDDACEITVLPYFLSAGNHVVHDIPAVIDARRCEHPQIRFNILPHFGQSDLLVDGLLAHIDSGCARYNPDITNKKSDLSGAACADFVGKVDL